MKPHKILTISLFVLIYTNLIAQDFPTGLILDRNSYEAIPIVPRTKDFTRVVDSFSLRQYCPTPGHQQKQHSCAAWATVYGARTIMAAIRGNITKTDDITAEALSPSFIYNQIKKESSCTAGTHLEENMATLLDQGCEQLKTHPYQCNLTKPDAQSLERAAPFKINGFFRLSDQDLVVSIKRAISNKKPVIIGAECHRSFMRAMGQKVWSGQLDSFPDGHAMVIVGFNNKVTEGGAFLVMNSWGTAWGDGGFIWVRYNDLLTITKQYYILDDVPTRLKKTSDNPPAPVSTEQKQLSGSFKLVDTNTTWLREMPAELNEKAINNLKIVQNEPTYKLTKPYASGTQFRLCVNNQVPAYIYILGYGSVSKNVGVLFPYDNISPYFPFTKSELVLPDAIKLEKPVGKEYLCVLFSTQPLDIETLSQEIQYANYPTFSEKLQSVLKSKMVTSGVQFEGNSISFNAIFSGNGSVVPIIVEVDHVK